MQTLVIIVGGLVGAACAGRQPPPATPDYRPIALAPASPQAALYADCLADATTNHRYHEAHDPSTDVILFTCTGAPAAAFFEGLAAYSARIGSQFVSAGRTYRSTSRVRHDLFGVDYCATDGATFECVVTLNASEFVH